MSTPRTGVARAGKIRIGVIGAGFGRAVHVPAYRADPRADVVAIAASSDESAKRAASEAAIPRGTGDWRTIVDDENIDAVSIVVPPPLQVVVARRAIAKGKHVFFEKPLSVTLAQAKALVAAAKKARIVHAIDFEFPEIPAWIKARQLLPQVGEVRQVVVQWHFETYAHRNRLDHWKVDPARGGGTLGHFVSHVYHNLEWLVGPITRLTTRVTDSGGLSDVIVDGAFTFASGAPGSMAVSANAIGGGGHTVEVFGENGMIRLHNPGPKYFDGFTLTLVTKDGMARVPADPLPNDRIEVVAKVIRRFLDGIEQGSPVEPNLSHGLRVQKLLDASRRANRQRSWVKV